MADVGNLHWADVVVIVAYFVIVISVGIWSSFRSKRGSVSGFFLAGRSMNWFLVGASLFGSNIGSGHFVGLAGSGAASGIAVAGFELNAIFVLVLLGWLFVPVYISSGVYTMPEYLKKRFGGQRIRVYLSCLALLLYVFTKISADLFAGAIFIKQSFNLSLYPSIGILLIMSCIFTVAGGLTAVIWTDAVQVVIMLFGAAFLTGKVFTEVGGYNTLISKYFVAHPSPLDPSDPGANITACQGFPRQDALHLLRDPVTGDLPWPGMIFGITFVSIWYWCTDQVIVQRVISAKNFSHAKGGCVFAGWLKFLPLWLLVFPGMAARVLFADDVACKGCSNKAFPLLVIKILGPGLRGLMLACMLSALMTSLTSVFNSSSTIFTIDIWKMVRKKASERELLIVGKLFVVVLVVLSILWIPLIDLFPNSQLFNYIQSVQSYLGPPVCAVYLLAVFWPRTTEPGAFWGLMMGLIVGLIRFFLEVGYGSHECHEVDNRPLLLKSMHYLYFGIFLFLLSSVVTIVISLFTRPIDKQHLYRLTFWSRFSEEDRISLSEFEIKEKKMSKQTVDLPDEKKSEGNKKKIWWISKVFGEKDDQNKSNTLQTSDNTMNSLKEKPFWKNFCDVQALLMLAVAVFMYAFYA